MLFVAVAACGAREAPATAPEPAVPPPGRAAQVVNAAILANDCKDLGPTAARLTERAMDQLVEGCSVVPGGTARFQATLRPGGRVEISRVAGEPDVVPICILKHALQHNVPLKTPCHLDVKIEQSSVVVGD